jgi:hypothetical protein
MEAGYYPIFIVWDATLTTSWEDQVWHVRRGQYPDDAWHLVRRVDAQAGDYRVCMGGLNGPGMQGVLRPPH